MRRCLILRQGTKPPETPGPLSPELNDREGKLDVKGLLRRAKNGRALDLSLSFPRSSAIMGKGALVTGGILRLPLVGPEEWLITRGRKSVLDKYRPSHGRRRGGRERRVSR
jgi:hypothetical protein